jgi:hypothetical protein
MGDMNFGLVLIDHPFCDVDESTGKKIKYKTLGISNLCLLKDTRNDLMFYDIDSKNISEWDMELILSKFPNDCLMFETTKGYHFVSLTLDLGSKSPLIKAKELSKELEEDYYFEHDRIDYLTLRIAPKTENKIDGKIHKPSPRFLKVLKLPRKSSILSLEHFRIYSYLGLPEKYQKIYLKRCKAIDYKTKYFYYFCNN